MRTSVPLKVNNFKVDDDNHWSFLIDDHVNKAVEIQQVTMNLKVSTSTTFMAARWQQKITGNFSYR